MKTKRIEFTNRDAPVPSVQTITPSRALDLLTRPGPNRALRKHHITKLAQAILRGEWVCNGESIIIAKDGTVLDGQHRLHACVEADIAIECTVVENVDVAVFDTIDLGLKRSVADALQLGGEINATLLAAALRHIRDWTGGWSGWSIPLSPREADALLRVHPRARDSVGRATSAFQSSPLRGALSGSIATYMDYACHAVSDEETAGRFMDGLIVGEGLRRGDARLTCRNRFLMIRSVTRAQIGQREAISVLIRAWNAWIKGRQLTAIRGTAGNTPPEMIGEREYFRSLGE